MADPAAADASRIRPVSPVPFRERAHPPVPLTSFVGRARAVAAVAELLRRPGVRLVTLTGPGGVGKTRLAIRAAEAVAADFPDGVWFVPLAAIRDPTLVAGSIAQALGVWETNARMVEDGMQEFLRGRRALLVLDNYEHLLDAAPLAAELLAGCVDLTVMVTSRAVLRLSGEFVFAVPPLSLPMLDTAPDAETTVAGEAVQLFVERAAAGLGAFALTAANAPAVAAICTRLDGLPLAIELAAARLRAVPPATLLAHLDRRLPLLRGGSRDQPARLQTMRDAIAWSYDLLPPDERLLFRRLAVFAGGCTVEAAEAVASRGARGAPGESSGRGVDGFCSTAQLPDSWTSVLDGIASLVDKSLLAQTDGPNGEPRYAMLETVREFALEQLMESGETDGMRRRHAAHYLRFAETVGGPTGSVLLRPDPPLIVARIDAEIDNLRATLVWAHEHGELETFVRLLTAIDAYWAFSGRMGEARVWFDRVLAASGDAPASVRAPALRGAAWIARDLGDYCLSGTLAQASVDLFRELDDSIGRAEALLLVGLAAEDQGDLERAHAIQHQVIDLARPLGEPVWFVVALASLGSLARLQGDLALARRLLDEALAHSRATNNLHFEFRVRLKLGELALQRGDHTEAATALVEIFERDFDARILPESLHCSALIASARGAYVAAARLLGAAETARQRLGVALVPRRQQELAATEAAARSALGESAYLAAWSDGRALSSAASTAEAVALLSALAAPLNADAASDATRALGLTPRETEVLRLLADGGTNAQIGAALFISPETVRRHLTNIYGKLGVASRSEAIAFAHRRGVV